MASKILETQVRHEDDLTIIDLIGDIDGRVESELDTAYDEAEATKTNTILLNFAQVEYINSTGIALIVGILAKARQAKRKLMT